MDRGKNLHYEFEQFCLDPCKRVLWRDGEQVPLQAKALDTLLVLIENRDRVVAKDELIRQVWPDTFVEEINLTVNISTLRKALGESPNDHRYIVTAPRRGYRFVAEVKEIQNDETPSRAATQPPVSRWFPRVNLNRRILGALLRIASITLTSFLLSPKRQTAIQTIAVLPFTELGTHNEDHLGVGLADALITQLGAVRQIVVRPTSAVLKYQRTTGDPLAAGRELGVEAVLEGRVQRVGDRIRVTVQLLRVKDGVSLWAGSFDEDFTTILAVQDSISSRVAEALATPLTSDEKESLAKHHTTNHHAYHAHMKGRHFLTLWTEHGFRMAIESFEQAVAADPNYALAYAGLAEAWTLLGYYNFIAPAESFVNARRAAVKAMELDRELADAQLALATVKVFFEWDFREPSERFSGGWNSIRITTVCAGDIPATCWR